MATYIGLVRVNEPTREDAPVRHTQRIGLGVDVGKYQTGALLGVEDKLVVHPNENVSGEYQYSYSRGVLGQKEISGSVRNHKE